MLGFLGSAQGSGLVIVLIALLGVIYGIVCAFDDSFSDDFDPVCEQKCKKCINYDVCLHHGCKYDCKDEMTEEDLKKRGLDS